MDDDMDAPRWSFPAAGATGKKKSVAFLADCSMLPSGSGKRRTAKWAETFIWLGTVNKHLDDDD